MEGNSTIASAEKLIDIVEFLSAANGELTVSEIARQMHMHVSSVDRYLLTLQMRGYVEKDYETGCFRLNENLISIAESIIIGHPLTKRYLNVMHTLAYIYDTTTHIMAFCGLKTVTLHKDLQTKSISLNHAFFDPTRYHYCSAPGKLLLSTLTDEELELYLEKTRLMLFTPKTLSTKAAVREDILKVRARGYSIHDEEWLTGSFAISFPLRVHGSIQGAMTLMSGIERKKDLLNEAAIKHIQEFVREPDEYHLS